MLGEAPLPVNVLLFAITRVTRFGQREEEEKKKKRKKRREGSKRRNETASSMERDGPLPFPK